MIRLKQPDTWLYTWYTIFLVSMVCSLRAVSSISIALIILTGVWRNKVDSGLWFGKGIKLNLFTRVCILFFFVLLTLLIFSPHFREGIKNLQVKTAILFVPLALNGSRYISRQVYEGLMKWFVWILAAALLYCLLIALYHFYSAHADADIFLYHALVHPFRQHAVLVSIYLFIGLLYLLQKAVTGLYFYNRPMHFLLIVYFTCCIVLLSSKLVILFSGGCLLYYFFVLLKLKVANRRTLTFALLTGVTIVIAVLSTRNHISKRFSEVIFGNISMVGQREFSPAIYFNGLQFRLLEWRFVYEILTEERAWVTGTGQEAQTWLDRKYTSTHMYTGDGSTAEGGYLGYNTHNAFLQSLLVAGVPGLLMFILLCVAMAGLAIRRRKRQLTLVVLLLLVWCFSEAVLETQYDIMVFTFFPLFIYYGSEN